MEKELEQMLQTVCSKGIKDDSFNIFLCNSV